MTLPSDSSRKQFPENRIGNYTTTLARQILLEGSYEVGLSEILLPAPKRAVTTEQFIAYGTLAEKNSKNKIIAYSADAFGTFAAFDRAQRRRDYQEVDRLNYSEKESKIIGILKPKIIGEPELQRELLPFSFILRDRRIVLKIQKNHFVTLLHADQLQNVFGFDQKKFEAMVDKPLEFTADRDYTGPNNMYIMYIYCDIVEYGIVGDTLAPCVRCLPIVPTDDAPVVLRFENPHYVPVEKRVFSTIQVEIANDNGEEVRFNDGVSIIKLHFRPKKR